MRTPHIASREQRRRSAPTASPRLLPTPPPLFNFFFFIIRVLRDSLWGKAEVLERQFKANICTFFDLVFNRTNEDFIRDFKRKRLEDKRKQSHLVAGVVPSQPALPSLFRASPPRQTRVWHPPGRDKRSGRKQLD